MKLTLTYENLTDEEAELFLGKYIDSRIYFSKRLELVKQGEMNIKKKIIRLAESLKRELKNDSFRCLSFENSSEYMSKLVNALVKDLEKILEDE